MSRVKQKNRARNLRQKVEALRALPEKVAEALSDYDAKVRKINADKLLSDEGKRQQLQEARREIDGRLAELRQTYERSREEARNAVTEVLNPPPEGTTEEQLLAETRAERRWQRAQRALDNASDPLTELQRQIKAATEVGDVDTLRMLHAEVPEYLRVFANDEASQVAQLEIERAFGQVDEHAAEALAAQRVINGRGHAAVSTALHTAGEFVERGVQATIPSWPDDQGNVSVTNGPEANYALVPAPGAEVGEGAPIGAGDGAGDRGGGE